MIPPETGEPDEKDESKDSFDFEDMVKSPREKLDVKGELSLLNVERAALLVGNKNVPSLDDLYEEQPLDHFQRVNTVKKALKSPKVRGVANYLDIRNDKNHKVLMQLQEPDSLLAGTIDECSIHAGFEFPDTPPERKKAYTEENLHSLFLEETLTSILLEKGVMKASEHLDIKVAEMRTKALRLQKFLGTDNSYRKDLKIGLKKVIIARLLRQKIPIPPSLRFGISKEDYEKLTKGSEGPLGLNQTIVSELHTVAQEKKGVDMLRSGVHEKIVERIGKVEDEAFLQGQDTFTAKENAFTAKLLEKFPNPDDLIDVLIGENPTKK